MRHGGLVLEEEPHGRRHLGTWCTLYQLFHAEGGKGTLAVTLYQGLHLAPPSAGETRWLSDPAVRGRILPPAICKGPDSIVRVPRLTWSVLVLIYYPPYASASACQCQLYPRTSLVGSLQALTSYVKTESDGCCRGASEDSLATIANLPVLDASKRKKHLKKCEEACDLVPECNAIESAFNEIFSGRCDLIAGEVTRADDTTPACRGTGCFTKQCPGDLRALVEQATSAASLGGLGSLLTAGEESTADFDPSTGTDHGQQSEEEKNDTGPMILAVAACIIA